MLERASSSRVSDRFLARRRVRRRRIVIGLFVLAVLAAGGVLYELQQPGLRISRVEIFGGDPALANYAYDAMRGTYAGVIPRDSTFFVPESVIRSAIMSEHPEVAAVSVFRNGLTGLSIKPSYRVAIARWCGLTPTDFSAASAHGSSEYCYVFDANGFIFAAESSSTPPINPFTLYAPLKAHAEEPLRATVSGADELPGTFDLARQLGTLGSPVSRIVIRDDEVDQFVKSGTRITYVLGNEESAYTALVSAKENIDLASGSIDYIDLRFPGKMYVKKVEK